MVAPTCWSIDFIDDEIPRSALLVGELDTINVADWEPMVE